MKKVIAPVAKYRLSVLIVLLAGIIVGTPACNNTAPVAPQNSAPAPDTGVYTPPDTSTIPHDQVGDMIRYGRDLIVNTAYYLGPNGTVGHYLGNKMNCGNCHVDAGTRPFAFNFFSTYARYPQYRGRENEVLDVEQRINNCVERPMNGKPLPLGSKELIAMECYIKWVGSHNRLEQHVKGDESLEVEFPDRAADVQKGAAIYATECTPCHGTDGAGKFNADSSTYLYPPLWGPTSYQNGSSPSRVVKMARFIKANMPDKKATWQKPYLTDEQAIDVAAFVNDGTIHPRPQKKDRSTPDYPDYKMKAFDYESGPYVDSFSEHQHKFGPYKPIIANLKAHNLHVAD